jgi:flagellar hook-associated protein 2
VDSIATIDGLAITRSTNTVSDVHTGITYSYLATAGGAATITINRDFETEGDQIQTLVDAYNSVKSVVNGQLRYNGTVMGANTLFADATIKNLQRRLDSVVATSYPAAGPTAANGRDIGIKLNSDGTLAFDRAIFESAAAADHTKVERFMGTESSAGFSAAIATLVDDFTEATGSPSTDGHLLTKQQSINTRITDIDDRIETIEERAEALRDRLTLQYAQLEQTLSGLKSMGDQLLAALRF